MYKLLTRCNIFLYRFIFKMLQIIPPTWTREWNSFDTCELNHKGISCYGSENQKNLINLYGKLVPTKWIAKLIGHSLFGDSIQGWQCERSVKKLIWFNNITEAIEEAMSPLICHLYLEALGAHGIEKLAAQFGEDPVVVIVWHENDELNLYLNHDMKRNTGMQLSAQGSLNRSTNSNWKNEGKNNRKSWIKHWETEAAKAGEIYCNYDAKIVDKKWQFWPLEKDNLQNILAIQSLNYVLPSINRPFENVDADETIYELIQRNSKRQNDDDDNHNKKRKRSNRRNRGHKGDGKKKVDKKKKRNEKKGER